MSLYMCFFCAQDIFYDHFYSEKGTKNNIKWGLKNTKLWILRNMLPLMCCNS